MTDPAPNIALVGNEGLVVEGLRQILTAQGLPVTLTADSPAGLLDRVGRLRGEAPPALVILLDFPDPGSPARRALQDLCERLPDLRLALLLAELTVDQLADALEMNVRAVLLRSVSTSALFHAINLVMLDETVLPTALAAEILNRDGRGTVAARWNAEATERLTARDVEILEFLVSGLSNKNIARRLALQEGTIKVHVRQLLKKIGAENRTQAAIWALGHGFAARPRNGDNGG